MAPATSPGIAPLPPSVEEAYRRKCVQLKKRMAEVEETNDAARIRLSRLKRQVEKQRLERAFLLEQLAKRTSMNVEDSDGSPSPPPTPKDKPLRTKRGHRKASLTGAEGGPSFASQNDQMSPTSDTFNSQANTQESGRSARAPRKPKTNDTSKVKGDDKDGDAKSSGAGAGSSVKRPVNGFELYCEEMRPALAEKKAAKSKKKSAEDGDVDMEDADAGADEDADATEVNIDEELARGWTDMDQNDKDEFETRAAEELAKHKKAKDEARQEKEAADDKDSEEKPADKDDAAAEDKAEKAGEADKPEDKTESDESKAKIDTEAAAKDAPPAKDSDVEMAEAAAASEDKEA